MQSNATAVSRSAAPSETGNTRLTPPAVLVTQLRQNCWLGFQAPGEGAVGTRSPHLWTVAGLPCGAAEQVGGWMHVCLHRCPTAHRRVRCYCSVAQAAAACATWMVSRHAVPSPGLGVMGGFRAALAHTVLAPLRSQ